MSDETPAPEPQRPVVNDLAAAEMAARAASEATARTFAAMDARRPAPPPAPAGPDPLDQFLKEGTAIEPGKGKELLNSAIDARAAAHMNAAVDQVRKEARENEWRMANEMALQSAANQAPEIMQPANQAKFGAMIAKARMESAAEGRQLSPMDLVNRAVRDFKQTYGGASTAAPNPPRLETPSRTGLPGSVTMNDQKPLTRNAFETFFKMKPGTIQPILDQTEDMDKMTKEYIRTANKYLMDRKLFSSIPAIDSFMEEEQA